MEMPAELREAIASAVSRYKTEQLECAAAALTDGYKNESGRGHRLVTKEIETAAYAAVRMPATYGAVGAALQYALNCFDDELSSVLDVGAGTGAAGWAAVSLLENEAHYTCIEREPYMIALGKQLAAADPVLSGARWICRDAAAAELTEKADLVIASYTLNELRRESRRDVLLKLWNAAGKLLLIVEPGTPDGFHQLLEARSVLTEAGGQIAAPCPGNGACPVKEQDWCHFTVRVPRSRLHKLLKGAEVPYEDEKFTFLAVSKGECHPAEARILRHPVIESGRVTLSLCTMDGIHTEMITRKNADAFKRARKASCGDAFSEVSAERK